MNMIFRTLHATLIVSLAFTSQMAFAGSEEIPLLTSINQQINTLNKSSTNISSAIPASGFSVTKTLNNLFDVSDPLFPNVSTNKSLIENALDSRQKLHADVTDWTQASIKQQLGSMPSKIGVAFTDLANNSQNSLGDPLQGTMNYMTYLKPSYDTLYLPNIVPCNSTGCTHKPTDKIAQQNALSFNFDSLFSPTHYQDANGQEAARGYVQYALQTYKPLISSPSYSAQNGGKQNDSFFDMLNKKLKSFKENKEQANDFLINNVLKSGKFQEYWLQLRSIASQNTLILSNFNYITAERTPQTNLGAAFGLKDKEGNPVVDASPLQVESTLINNTANNPQWYTHIKTAPPATLQREQVMLMAQQVKLAYENKLVNERLLLTMSMLTHSMMQTNKQALSSKEMELKQTIFPDETKNEQNAQQEQMKKKYMPKNKGKK